MAGKFKGASKFRNPRFTRSGKKVKRRAAKKSITTSVSKGQVKKWNKAFNLAKVDIGTYTEYDRAVNLYTCGERASSFNSKNFNLTGIQAAVDALDYYNPATNALITTDITAAAFNNKTQEIWVELYTTATWINNYGAPLWIDTYLYVPKTDNSLNPVTCFTNGLVDKGSPSATSVFVYPSMSKILNDLWDQTHITKVCLGPGESTTAKFKKKFKYDPALVIDQTDQFQARFGAHSYGCRLEGCFGHSVTTPANLGSSVAKVDFFRDMKMVIKYGAGLNVKKIVIGGDDSADQTGGTVLGWPHNAANTVIQTGL